MAAHGATGGWGSGKDDVEAEAEGGGELAEGGEADVAGAVFQAGDRGLGGADLAGQFRLYEALGLAGAFQRGGELAAIGARQAQRGRRRAFAGLGFRSDHGDRLAVLRTSATRPAGFMEDKGRQNGLAVM